MRTKFSVVKLSDSILHIIIVQELNNATTILCHIGIAYVTCFTHVVLQVLPAARQRQTCTLKKYSNAFVNRLFPGKLVPLG